MMTINTALAAVVIFVDIYSLVLTEKYYYEKKKEFIDTYNSPAAQETPDFETAQQRIFVRYEANLYQYFRILSSFM